MTKLVPFNKFSRVKKSSSLNGVSVVMDKNVPVGFVFGRDSFISFLTKIDSEFEKKVRDPKIAFNNPAGRLIDLIEERLPLKAKFAKDLKESIKKTKKSDWISLAEITRSLNV